MNAKPTFFLLFVALMMFFATPVLAQTYTTSNGVTVEELSVVSSGNVNGHSVSWQTETMEVVTNSVSSTYATETIDGELFLEYHFYYDSNGEKRVSRIDATYQGVTKSQYGSGYHYGALEPCYEEPCPDPEMQYTPGTEAFLNFVTAAMLDLHSQQFLDEVKEADESGEVSTQGAWGCGASVIGYVASFAPFATCPTVVGCVGALIMHKVASVGLICSCMTDC